MFILGRKVGCAMIPVPGVILIWKGRKFLLEHWWFSPPYATIIKQLEDYSWIYLN
jgi:hypothetical protein